MSWDKEIKGLNSIDGLIGLGIIFVLVNFFQSSFVLMFLGGFLIIIGMMSRFYLKHIADYLVLQNNKEAIRVSVGEEFILPIKISQRSWMPIIHATLTIKIDPIIEGHTIPSKYIEKNLEITIPVQIKGNETIQISLPLIAKLRGVTRIKKLEIKISNFFSLGFIQLNYKPFIHKEIIVYPSLISVPNLDQLVATKSYGPFSSNTSMFEEILAPIGTRNYVYTDPFQRIHWKASAKAQVLQTKVYERTADYSWTFIINLRDTTHPNHPPRVVENIESIASNIAFMVHYAAKNNIDYEIFLNFNLESGVPVYHLPIGGGKTQLGKTYEILARINRDRITQPINKLLHFVEKQQRKSPVVIVCGPYGETVNQAFRQMKKNGQRVYYLLDDEDNPTIAPL